MEGSIMGIPNFVLIIPSVFLGIWVLLCLATIINPRYMWTLTQGWKATKEPPRAYFILMRLMGILFLLVFSVFFFPVFIH
ncbi:DUF6199 family natural product biosynthesis protein [Paenibacillus sp. BR2-3]|uniref:DUF6199 family natural product biosynthesis protein n=1 Tax=Paenibacillus sp. BR2-3 TaxID=3048494 RepID=UPI00397765B5